MEPRRLRSSPMSPGAATARQRPSFLLKPDELANQTVLSPQEASKRLQDLALFSSLDNLPSDVTDVLSTPRLKGLTAAELQNLREAHEMTKDNTPQKQFEEFLLSRINRGDFVQRITEEDFAAKYTFGDQLGDGATSSVRVARNTRGEEFACKIIPAKMLVTHRSLFREVAILSKIQHPNIIRLVESFLTDSNLYLVMEYARGVALFEHILCVRTYSEKDARDLIKTLLQALLYLHSQGVAHRDLKPENIIVDAETQTVKIVDFGFAGVLDPSEDDPGLSTPTGGTPGYKAPDYFSTHYGKSVDVWSLGVISYILMCGFPPFFSSEKLKEIDYLSCAPFWFFFNSDTDELRNEIRDGKINFPSPFWDKITDAAKSFVRALLTVSEEQRLTAAEALEHEWIVSEIADTKNDDESTTHLLVDPFRDSPELFESLDGLPEIVSTRMQELRTLLEQRLARRPSLQHLRQSGIFRSSEHL